MQYFHFIAVGLVSLVCTITATPFNGKPEIAKRLQKRATVTATFAGCTAVCWDATSGIECDKVQCEDTQLQTPAPTPGPVLEDRAAATSSSEELWPIGSFYSSVEENYDCEEMCGTNEDGDAECILLCSDRTQSPEAPLTTSPAKLEARADAQARHAREARLAGKYGLVPRDNTVTVTVTSFPASCSVAPQESAIQQASVALSEASAAIAQVVGGTAVAPILPPAASAALSAASAFLSSITVLPVAPLPLFANATVVPGPSAPGVVPATASNAAVATSQAMSPVPPSATSSISKGAAAEGKNSGGFFLMILTGLLGNIALML